MKKEQVLAYNLSTPNLDLIKSKSDDLQLKTVVLEDLRKPYAAMESAFSLFVEVDSKFKVEDLLAIFTSFESIPINIIFKEENFDLLLVSFKHQVSMVFTLESLVSDIDSALLKAELINQKRENKLPIEQILKLFTIPVKIRTDEDLHLKLKSYLENVAGMLEFSILKLSGEVDQSFGTPVPAHIVSKIRDWKLPRKYISLENTIDDWIVTATFSNGDESSFLCLKIDKDYKDYVLNEHFYKFLENTLIYRMNLLKKEKLELLASTDEITGLYNQRKLAEDLEKTIKSHSKEHETFSLMFIDVDHFKDVNDNYGHIVGSQLLVDIGTVLHNILRQSDHIYRYGGDEFVVIMPYVDIKLVHEIATRVLTQIKSKDFLIDNGEIYKLSVSIGIAEYPTDANSAKEIIKFADEMMYMSKRSGRGKVFHVGEVEDASTRS